MKRCPFTLIEMLVVLVITGVLLGLAIPAFERLTVGTGVDAAARMVGGQLRLTRQYAISTRTRVALLMPRDEDPVTGRRFAAIRACQVQVDPANLDANTFISWIPNTKWDILPVGAVIAELDTVARCSNPPTQITTSYVTGVDTFTSTSQVRAIVFKANGRRADSVDGPKYITIIEGYYGSGTNCTVRNPNNQIDISVDSYTGRVSYE